MSGGLLVTLLAGTAGCQLAHTAGASETTEARSAVDRLLSREAVTLEASFDASPDDMLVYLTESAERTGAPEPGGQDAEVLSALELTAVVGDSGRERAMRDRERDEPLSVALSVGFGGKDAVGIKQIDGETYLRVGAETITQDVLGGDAAEVIRAEQFTQRASDLPAALDTASRALSGSWVLVDPFLYQAYGEALDVGDLVSQEMARRLATALTEADPLLEPDAQWRLADTLLESVRSSGTLRDAGEEAGAQVMELRLPAANAAEAMEPLLKLLDRQTKRFGLPPVVHAPADPDAMVTANLAVRNGVLSHITFDLGQFNGPDAAELPMRLNLNGGSAISLTAPDAPILQPEDLTVALLYLDLRDEMRKKDPERGNLPGPIQP